MSLLAADYLCTCRHHSQPIGVDELEAEGTDIISGMPDVTVSFDDAGLGLGPNRWTVP
jgi:hypothetical protein